jgi:hypothetical protein
MAVKNHLGRRRYTKLGEWLTPEQLSPNMEHNQDC